MICWKTRWLGNYHVNGSCVSYRWDSLYQRVSIAALTGKAVAHKISCGWRLSGNSLVAYRRHCLHRRYRRANLRSSLPSMVNFLTNDRLNTTNDSHSDFQDSFLCLNELLWSSQVIYWKEDSHTAMTELHCYGTFNTGNSESCLCSW